MNLVIDLSDEELEKTLPRDRDKDLLVEQVVKRILQAKMTEVLVPIRTNGARTGVAIGKVPTSAS
jgi:hypothetical protein